MAEIADDELAGLSEFALLRENAEQAGVTGPLPGVERVRVGAVSALRWRAAGAARPRAVFPHGGAQNAHTWDTVIIGLGEPALAVDLPWHGRSAWRGGGEYTPQRNAATLQMCSPSPAPGTRCKTTNRVRWSGCCARC